MPVAAGDDTPPVPQNGRMSQAPAANGDSEPIDAAELRELSGYALLAQRLKEAHEALRDLDLPHTELAELNRRLLVITAASRHDRSDALRRLEAFLDALVLRHKGD
jgi:hypothetical protein